MLRGIGDMFIGFDFFLLFVGDEGMDIPLVGGYCLAVLIYNLVYFLLLLLDESDVLFFLLCAFVQYFI